MGLGEGSRQSLMVGWRGRGLIGPIERLADLAAEIRARQGAERNRRELTGAAADLRADESAETRAHQRTAGLLLAHAADAGAALLATRDKEGGEEECRNLLDHAHWPPNTQIDRKSVV